MDSGVAEELCIPSSAGKRGRGVRAAFPGRGPPDRSQKILLDLAVIVVVYSVMICIMMRETKALRNISISVHTWYYLVYFIQKT